MDDLSVDVDELRRTAATVRGLGEQLASAPAVKFGIEPRQSGDDVLAGALDRLHEASRHSVSVVNDGATRTADRLMISAQDYADTEQAHLDALATVDTTPPEVP
jgi:hypothetical protein